MPQIRRWWQSSSPNAGETVRPPESGCGGSEKDESARKMAKPLAIDLFCGLGGWTEGLLAEGYDVVGFDIERHVYGEHRYPAQLVIQDVLTLHGSQFRNAALGAPTQEDDQRSPEAPSSP